MFTFISYNRFALQFTSTTNKNVRNEKQKLRWNATGDLSPYNFSWVRRWSLKWWDCNRFANIGLVDSTAERNFVFHFRLRREKFSAEREMWIIHVMAKQFNAITQIEQKPQEYVISERFAAISKRNAIVELKFFSYRLPVHSITKCGWRFSFWRLSRGDFFVSRYWNNGIMCAVNGHLIQMRFSVWLRWICDDSINRKMWKP